MPISFAEASQILERVGREASQSVRLRAEKIPLEVAFGRHLCEDAVSPISTPPFDTSAMDGIAVNSNAILKASENNPITLSVKGTIAAGDEPLVVSMEPDEDGVYPCVEIMTGARFPASNSVAQFDACVPVEYVMGVCGPNPKSQYVQVYKPATENQHRRFAGCDFQKHALLAEAGTKIEPQHVMAMASVGLSHIKVLPKIRVGIWSTGKELATSFERDRSSRINDANGPFLLASLQHAHVESHFLGVLEDARDSLALEISRVVEERRFDILITSGAVSAGKFDYVRDAIEDIGATVHFHKVAIRPGHPVLFAEFLRKSVWNGTAPAQLVSSSVPCHARRTAFFGLPGNPVAAAACWRVFGTRYVQHLLGRPAEEAVFARVLVRDHQPTNGLTPGSKLHTKISTPAHLDIFRHGFLSLRGHELQVEININQSSSRIQPFVEANCWVHIPQDHSGLQHGDILRCYSLVADQPII